MLFYQATTIKKPGDIIPMVSNKSKVYVWLNKEYMLRFERF